MGHELISNFMAVGLYLFVIPAALIFGLTLVNRNTKRLLATAFSMNSQVYFGFIGIFLHEFSHYLVAKLFGHKIVAVRFLKLPKSEKHTAYQPEVDSRDRALGYVNHTWNQRNIYQVLGNLFIGIAPIFGCTLALLGFARLLVPSLFNAMTSLLQSPASLDWSLFFMNLTVSNQSFWLWLLFIVISLNISIGGFDLSRADLNNSWQGFISFTVLIVLVTLLLTFVGVSTWWIKLITQFGLIILIVLGYSLVISLIAHGLVRLVYYFKIK
ncbi:hypothetical protein [Secundilactobacillus malefermentans]|uniref:Uncharacterized protein n=1 Tax=Secundilactobacillus malefermentans TaxID=176292 RepID=A0A4R5NRD2_9LACO|nr:hypothetical protein [Secundilactobacillus malefermentans]QEA31622.1 hypothetical protein FGL90_05185 [Secundilactobacillus malefermentans]TDG78955.1 hypothetical protein C5L31_000550 [Secundilactobacillus malefermentans]